MRYLPQNFLKVWSWLAINWKQFVVEQPSLLVAASTTQQKEEYYKTKHDLRTSTFLIVNDNGGLYSVFSNFYHCLLFF